MTSAIILAYIGVALMIGFSGMASCIGTAMAGQASIGAMKKNAAATTKLLQISYIPRGSEIATSRMLASVPVPLEVRKVIQRVAIVEPGYREDYIAKAGYVMFVRFGRDSYTFNRDDIKYTDKESRWDDVPEKV